MMIPERVRLDEFNDVPLPDERTKPLWGSLADVEMKPVRWLKRPFWQADAFHLLVGEKGCGKGTFLAGLAAKVTRSGKRVLWVAAGEDSLAIDVKPRILAAGGDVEMVYVPHGRLYLPDCVEDLRFMGQMTRDLGLIVLDPIVGMMRGKKDSNADLDIRSTIDPLNSLADELACPIVGVRHLGKDTQRQALHRVLGGVDWVNIPRAVVAIAVDDEDIRHVQVISGNRVPPGEDGRAFAIEEVALGNGITSTRCQFNGIGKDVEDVLAKPKNTSKTKAAKILMLDILDEEGKQESDALTARVAQETGLAVKTVKNAKTDLKDDGLIKFTPGEKNAEGKPLSWLVYRSLAPRPDTLSRGVPDTEGTVGSEGVPDLTVPIGTIDTSLSTSSLSTSTTVSNDTNSDPLTAPTQDTFDGIPW